MEQADWREQMLLKDRVLAACEEGITITDPSLPDNPLIYVNQGFERLTGYTAEEVLGRNCRFLQGPQTDPEAAEEIRRSVREHRPCTVEILNYRKDGSPFWNRLSITPVRDSSGRVTHYIGIQSDVTARRQAEEALREATRQLEAADVRMKRDLEAAARIQRALLPSPDLRVPGISAAWAFQPSTELAGDLFNLFPLGEDHAGFYVLDVSGHGVPAALVSMAVTRLLNPAPGRSVLFQADPNRPGQYRLASPSSAILRLNEFFPFDPRTAQYFTLVYCLLNCSSGELRYTAAGHIPPILVPKSGDVRLLEPGGPPVGLLTSPEIAEHTVHLAPGDRIYLCTDGILEAENPAGQEFGMERLLARFGAACRQTLEDSVQFMLAGVKDWGGGSGLIDDATILAVERNPASPDGP
jgi:sigma-B regulation protein RsbU (phosphoserine phosphatase)